MQNLWRGCVYRGMYPLVLLPLALKGYSPLAGHYLLILVCNFVSFFLIDGISTKTGCGGNRKHAGCACGSSVCTDRAECMSITTYQMDEAETLLLITSTTELKIRDLFLCGILISCMGAVMGCGDEYLFRGGRRSIRWTGRLAWRSCLPPG